MSLRRRALALTRELARGARRRVEQAALRAAWKVVPDRATPLDVFFAYRLLLKRMPDPDGFSHHLRRLSDLKLAPAEVAADLLKSVEAKAPVAQARTGTREAVAHLDGFALVVDPDDAAIGRVLLEKKMYERFLTEVLAMLLRPGDTFIDVGANVGYFACLAATRVGRGGRVVAFEPVPRNAALLEKSVVLNVFPHVTVQRKAAAAGAGRVRLAQPDAANGGSFTIARDGALEVETVALDAMLDGRVDVVKVDVEGAEGLVFDGMQAVLEREKPVVLLEYTPSRLKEVSGRSGLELLRAFEAKGYGAQEVASYTGRFEATPVEVFDRLLAQRGEGHLDLVLFPREGRPRRV